MNILAGQFAGHLKELRNRLLVAFLAIILATAVAYAFSEELIRFLMAPLRRSHPAMAHLVYTNLTEAFVSYLKVSLLTGLIAGFPVCCYELWSFISPGLHRHEKRFAKTVVFWASALFAAGVVFAYLVVLPETLDFLLGFAGERLEPMLRLDAYLSFAARTALALGLAFEVPFLMVMAMRAGIVARDYFPGKRKYFYLAILILAFLLAAGELIATFLLALPLFALYEIGILIGRLFGGATASSVA